MNRSIVSGFALIAALASTAPVFAQDVEEVRTMRVSFADLNLSDPAGARVFEARLHGAVRAVCGDAEAADLSGLAAVSRCRRAAWAGAKEQAEQIYAGRGGSPIVLAAK